MDETKQKPAAYSRELTETAVAERHADHNVDEIQRRRYCHLFEYKRPKQHGNVFNGRNVHFAVNGRRRFAFCL